MPYAKVYALGRLHVFHMRCGNIIAGFLLSPFFIVFTLSITGLTPRHPANDGIFSIILILSAYTFFGSFLYLIFKNSAYLNNTAIVRIIHRHIGVIRICLLILLAFVTAVVVLVPKKRIAPVRDIRVSSVSSRL
ncbi:hypothetical protein [Methylobacterium sp. Leaf94]|uniref:hypothetical protein n=1 Tax=Methylobacterium sp. Leaf94 TaxID=1736250 RepID=UPI000AD2EFA3|nr:hypothetical protein [Methylobacterium sp. Leaf94]